MRLNSLTAGFDFAASLLEDGIVRREYLVDVTTDAQTLENQIVEAWLKGTVVEAVIGSVKDVKQ